jgi:hypothetical protein
MGIVVEPNPAPEGGRITVTVTGNGPYYVRAGGSTGDWAPLNVDPDTGKVTIDVQGSPPQTVDISNRDDNVPDTVSIPIENSEDG